MIKQCASILKFFREPIKKKYGLTSYTNKEEPLFMFGCYPRFFNHVRKHKGFLLIAWAGTDGVWLHNYRHFIKHLRSRENTYHIALSKFLSDDLTKAGIEHKIIPITPFVNKDIKPKPRGEYLYQYSSKKHPERYNCIMAKRAMALSCIKGFTATKDKFTREELLGVYERCFMGLRLTEHDGMPNTVAELGLMGRRCIYNGGTPNAIPWKGEKDIVRSIQKEYERRGADDTEAVSEAMREYLDVGTDWLNVEYWKS